MIYTTLNKIRDHSPCEDNWIKLLQSLNKTKSDDEPLSLIYILDLLGLDDALWCTRTLPEYDKKWGMFAAWCFRQIRNLMADQRSINALDVAERSTNGDATEEELDAARAETWIATMTAAMAAFRAAQEKEFRRTIE